ncbi:MAG: peptidase MA family metallohydrolase, partial [Armatimonadota bacterium]
DTEHQLRAQAERVQAAFGDAGEHVRLADLLSDAGWHRLAVEEYEKARALDPSVNTGGKWERAVQALRRDEQLRQWKGRLDAQRAAELALEGRRLAQQDRSAVSARKPPAFLVSDYAIVRHHAAEPMLADAMAALEEAHCEAVTVFGFPMEPVSVSIFRTRQEYQAFRQFRGETMVPEWSGGTSGIDGILTYSHAGVGKSVAHEYGHEAVHQFARDARVPVWLDEGIAVIMEDAFAHHAALTAELYRRRRGAFFPITDLSGAWSRLPGEMARYAYAQARGMVEFLLARWGRERVLAVLRDLRRGATYDEAFVRNLGVSQAGFEQEWARHALTQMPRRGRRGTRADTGPAEAPGGRGG